MPTINLSLEALVAQTLARQGYAHLDGRFFGAHDHDLKKACDAFVDSCRDLPKDDTSTDGNRNRRYGTLILLPWNWRLEPVPPVWDPKREQFVSFYIQSAYLNPEHAGKLRPFASLTEEQVKNPFLQHAIITSFRALRWKFPNQPVSVGCHIIELTAKPGSPAASSPDLVHQDGEHFTFAALIERRGIAGGENLITVPEAANKHPSQIPDSAIKERFTLQITWDGWVVDDERVAHYVSPIEVSAGCNTGNRIIILIDFTPMIPDIRRH